MRLTVHIFTLLTTKVFTTSHGSATSRKSLVVELEHEGVSGFGEATEILYYHKNRDKMIQDLMDQKTWIEGLPIIHPKEMYKLLTPKFDDLFVLCAIDMAYNDLYGKLIGLPLYKFWGLEIENNQLSSFTIGLDEPNEMLSHMLQHPWPMYKVKLGSEADMDIMRLLRAHSQQILRVDVNEGWNMRQVIQNSILLKELEVEYIEQPLPAIDHKHMPTVFTESALPVFADESCHTLEDIEKCAHCFHGINIKLMKCGGLSPALEMITKAREYNLKIMIGCMTETSIGISALAQILPLVDYADMDGALLIKNDPASGVMVQQGKIVYPDIPGTGADLIYRNPI